MVAAADSQPAGPVELASPERTPLLDVAGPELLAGLRGALAWLQANQEAINDLNVFPVPDGDTGSNMYLTLRSAVEDAQHAGDPASASSVVGAAAHGSLMGARGNSGVILSQILRGFSQGLAGSARVDARGIATALEEATAVAYKAVMKPTEGTILTVVRESATAAAVAAAGQADIRQVLGATVAEAHASVERTPTMLAVLREAGVVDAGGFGYAVILDGFHRALDEAAGLRLPPAPAVAQRRVGEPQVRRPGAPGETAAPGRRGASAVAASQQGWGYCTEFLIHGPDLDVDAMREALAKLGDSALVVGDPELIRVHIHTHDPAQLIAAATQRGRISKLKVEDMSEQHHEVLARASEQEQATGEPTPPAASPAPAASAEPKPLAIVTVAPGQGFRDILLGLGADHVVEGGQTMNPSIEDLLNGVRACGAQSVIVLPNNGNVILTAQQVDQLADGIEVHVVASKNLPQGISAMLALDWQADAATNVERMEEALTSVRAVEVTRAVRASTANGHRISEGDVIALVDDQISGVGDDITTVVDAVLDDLPAPPELVTVYRGAGVGEEEAEALVSSLHEKRPDLEVELQVGGQEHYPYILSVE